MADDPKKDINTKKVFEQITAYPTTLIPGKIVLIYVILGGVWIVFSDLVLGILVKDLLLLNRLQTLKGWFYVGITSALLYLLIQHYLKQLSNYQNDLLSNYEELESAYEEGIALEAELQDHLTQLQEKQQALIETEEKYRLVVEGSNECIWDWDIKNHRMNFRRTKILLGYEADELPDAYEAWASLVHPEDIENTASTEQQHLDGKTPFYYSEYRMRNKWGEYRWIQARGKAVWDSEGKPLRIAGSHVDVTEQKRLMKEMYEMAYYDELTQLPNRTFFYDHLKKILASHQRRNQQFGILTLDLDDFRRINDTRGHPVGDRILMEVAERIQGQMKQNEFVARSGGDEFYILKSKLESSEELQHFAEGILGIFEAPFKMEEFEFFISASAGIAIYPDHGTDRDTLLQHVDVALSEAKTSGKNKFWVFDQTIRDRVTNWMEQEKDLRYAVHREEFVLFYQPVINVKDESIVGVEALIRWNHPHKGLLSPVFFMELAEETDLIHPIGEWVLETVCKTCRSWKDEGLPPLTISMNLSPIQFRRADLAEWIGDIMNQYDVDPCQLIVEITETVAMDNLPHTQDLLKRIRDLGVKVALDDFGTGYSSLNYLRYLPLDILKIDKSFIRELGANPKETFIVKQIIDMAHELNLTVTAEGVEELDQLKVLQENRCDHLQGYYYYKPMPEGDLKAIMSADRNNISGRKE